MLACGIPGTPHLTYLFAEAAPLHIQCDGFLLPFAFAVLQGLGDVGGVDEVGAFEVGDGAGRAEASVRPHGVVVFEEELEDKPGGGLWRKWLGPRPCE